MKIDIIFYVDYFAANIRKPTQIYAKVLQKKVSSDMEILNKKLFE